MNILVINYEYPPLGGGGGIFTRDLVENFAKKHNVDLVTSHFSGLKKTESINNVTIYRVPVLGRRSLYSATMSSLLSFPFASIAKCIQLFRSKKYDIINTHFAVPTGPTGMILSGLSRIPNVLSIHGSDIYNPVRKTSPHRHAVLRWAVRSVLKNAAKVVAQSTDIRYCAEAFYAPGRDITIIPLGLPDRTFNPASRETLLMQNGKFYIISIGRMTEVKGYDFLIRAIGLLRERGADTNLVLIGDGPERVRLENLSAKLGLSDRIKFTGWLSHEKKFQYLSACDIYVMSSLHEGFGVVLLEAMSCGLPIIATNKGGQTDIIKEGRNGILIQPYDAEMLADAISRLAESPDKRRAMSATNKEDVKNYGISAVAKRYLDLFDRVLSERRKEN